ncbi:MAG: tetratricopeptide repeat protein, partial [Thermoguttaceae bacterium]
AGYSSRTELDEWLARAVGEHYRYLELALEHANAALALCPLQGEAYLYLGELAFLEPGRQTQTWDYVEQALRVRPHNGTVLFHAGCEAWLAGRGEQGLDYWLKSYRSGRIYQQQIIDWTAGRVPLEFVLSGFEPDLEMLQYMQSRYQSIAAPAELTPLLEAIVRASYARAQSQRREGNDEAAAESWLTAMSANEQMLRLDDAATCGRQAVQCDPHSFDARYRLGFLLSEAGRYAEADEHLTWCSRVKPGNNKLKRRLTDVKRMLLEPEGTDERRLGRFYPPGTDFAQTSLQLPAPPSTTWPAENTPPAGTPPPGNRYLGAQTPSLAPAGAAGPTTWAPPAGTPAPAAVYRR